MSKNISAHSLKLVDSISLHDVLHIQRYLYFQITTKEAGNWFPWETWCGRLRPLPRPPTHTVGGAHHHPVIDQQSRDGNMEGTTAGVIPWRLSCSWHSDAIAAISGFFISDSLYSAARQGESSLTKFLKRWLSAHQLWYLVTVTGSSAASLTPWFSGQLIVTG